MSSGKVLLGFLAGAALGSIAAILLAPEKGKVTRENIVDKTGDFLSNFKERYNHIIDSLTSTLDSVAEDGHLFNNETQTEINNVSTQTLTDFDPSPRADFDSSKGTGFHN